MTRSPSPTDRHSGTPRGPVERLLAALDRLPGLGGGITHLVFLSLFFGTCLSLYLAVLRLRGAVGERRKTHIGWDDYFPFTPWWVWIYLLPYVLGPLLTVVMSRTAFAWYVRRAMLVVLVSLVIFAAVPTQTVRPLVADPANADRLGHGRTADLYRWMVEIDDPPANAAPSLHVSLSCLLAWAMAYDFPRWWAATVGGAVLIWLSTLFTAQHHLIDVLTGVLLASLAAIRGPHHGRAAPSV